MLRKRFLIPFSGNLPAWLPQYVSNAGLLARDGWEFVFINEAETRRCYKEQLDVTLPDFSKCSDRRKLVDIRPAMGVAFSEYVRGCDYWGQTDMDCVYGNLSKFVPDERLSLLDIWSNDIGAICGPFTLYRNDFTVNWLFAHERDWQEIFKSPKLQCFDEHGFSKVVDESGVTVSYNHMMGENAQDLSGIELRADGSLWQHGKEIMMFHFNHDKRWPCASA